MYWHRVCWRKGSTVHILDGLAISPLWHFSVYRMEVGGEETEKEYITGGLCTQHAKPLAGVCHSELSMKVWGEMKDRGSAIVCMQ